MRGESRPAAKQAARGKGVAALLLALGIGAWLGGTALSSVVCGGDYTLASNDFCERWRLDPPAEGQFPRLPGWSIDFHDVECSSSGCPIGTYAVAPAPDVDDPLEAWARDLGDAGWSVTEGKNASHNYWVARKGDLQMLAEAATPDRGVLIPVIYTTGRHVLIAFSLASEGINYE